MDYIINNLNNINKNYNISLNELSLSELKNILYSNKNLLDKDKIKIKTLINNKIGLSKKTNHNITKIKSNIEINTEINTESESNSESNSETESIDSKDILIENNDINKLFDRVDKKGQNQRFTQTSQKLLDRMFSEASYINNYQVINNNMAISKPYIDDNKNNKKLGIRKNINL